MDDISKRIEDIEREFEQHKAERDKRMAELHDVAYVRSLLIVDDVPFVAINLKQVAKRRPTIVSDPEVQHWMKVHHDEFMVFWDLMKDYPERLAAHRDLVEVQPEKISKFKRKGA